MPKTLLLPFLCSAVVAILLLLSSSQRLAAQTDPEAGLRKYAENPIQSWEDVKRIQEQIDPELRKYAEKPPDYSAYEQMRRNEQEKLESWSNEGKIHLEAYVVSLLVICLLVGVIRLLLGRTGFQELRDKSNKLSEEVKNRPEIILVWAAAMIAAWARRVKAWMGSSRAKKAEAQKIETVRLIAERQAEAQKIESVRLMAARLVARKSAGGGLETEAQKSVWDDWDEHSTPKLQPETNDSESPISTAAVPEADSPDSLPRPE
jgi:hypothetical protein